MMKIRRNLLVDCLWMTAIFLQIVAGLFISPQVYAAQPKIVSQTENPSCSLALRQGLLQKNSSLSVDQLKEIILSEFPNFVKGRQQIIEERFADEIEKPSVWDQIEREFQNHYEDYLTMKDFLLLTLQKAAVVESVSIEVLAAEAGEPLSNDLYLDIQNTWIDGSELKKWMTKENEETGWSFFGQFDILFPEGLASEDEAKFRAYSNMVRGYLEKNFQDLKISRFVPAIVAYSTVKSLKTLNLNIPQTDSIQPERTFTERAFELVLRDQRPVQLRKLIAPIVRKFYPLSRISRRDLDFYLKDELLRVFGSYCLYAFEFASRGMKGRHTRQEFEETVKSNLKKNGFKSGEYQLWGKLAIQVLNRVEELRGSRKVLATNISNLREGATDKIVNFLTELKKLNKVEQKPDPKDPVYPEGKGGLVIRSRTENLPRSIRSGVVGEEDADDAQSKQDPPVQNNQYTVELTESARTYLDGLESKKSIQIRQNILPALSRDPKRRGFKSNGGSTRTHYQGRFRIDYLVDDTNHSIIILNIGNRN